MHIIDQYAYTNNIRAVDPAQKAGLAVVVLVTCLIFDHPAVGLVAAGWMWGIATWQAGLSAVTFGRVLLTEAIFLVLATVGVALTLGLSPPLNPASWTVQLGPVWLGTNPENLWMATLLVTRALGAAAAMNFLALTTPLVDLVELLRRLRLPPLLIDLMTLIYRQIFVLLESLNRMAVAQASRLGYSSYRRSMVSAGLLGSQLFIDAYRRAWRLQIALESRGYFGGDLQVLPVSYYWDRKLWGLVGLIVGSLILVGSLL